MANQRTTGAERINECLGSPKEDEVNLEALIAGIDDSPGKIKELTIGYKPATEWTTEKFEELLPKEDTLVVTENTGNKILVRDSIYTILKFYGGGAVNNETLCYAYYTLLANQSHADKTITGSRCSLSGVTIDISELIYHGSVRGSEISSHRTFGGVTKSNLELEKMYQKVVTKFSGLSELKTDKDRRTFQGLIDFTLYLALLVWRLSKRREEEVTTYIMNRAQAAFNSLFGCTEFEFFPPSKYSRTTLLFSTHAYKQMLATVVRSYFDTESEALKQVYHAACLLSLQENGLGLITWTLKASVQLGPDSLEAYLKYLSNERTGRSVLRFRKLWEKSDKPKAWQFCRCFESSAMSDYATKENREMCLIGAYISLGVEETEARMMDQFKGILSRPLCRWVAEYLLKKFGATRSARGKTAETRRR